MGTRKAEAFKRLCGQLVDYSDESVEAVRELERACVSEAVAPALEYLDQATSNGDCTKYMAAKLRRLLTEGRE